MLLNLFQKALQSSQIDGKVILEVYVRPFEPSASSRPVSCDSTALDIADFDSILLFKVIHQTEIDENSIHSQDLVSSSSKEDTKTIESTGFVISKMICNSLYGDL